MRSIKAVEHYGYSTVEPISSIHCAYVLLTAFIRCPGVLPIITRIRLTTEGPFARRQSVDPLSNQVLSNICLTGHRPTKTRSYFKRLPLILMGQFNPPRSTIPRNVAECTFR